MATWTWPVAVDSALEVTPQVRVARFGDGYEQRAAAGLRSVVRSFAVRLSANIDTVKAAEEFLRARAGVESFDWTPLDHQPGKFVCRKWSVRYGSGSGADLDAVFDEVWT
jgi:phage-related protein